MEPCTACESLYPIEDLTEFDGALLCPDCLNRVSTVCRECGDRIRREDNCGSYDHPLCCDCRDEYYTVCERCGRLIRNDEAEYLDDSDYAYCPECFEIVRENSIHDYYYKPFPKFYGEGPRYLGVELELDCGGELSENAASILEIANRDRELIYCKHDGSLDDGFEIVTHPMSLDFHEHEMPWAEILEKAIALGYRSHQAETCGLHIHVSRDAFGYSTDEQDEAIARILYFIERNWNELLVFSRRTQRQLDRWAARYGYKDRPSEMLEQVKKSGSRYTCVNLSNRDTIEFRIFRGTLKLNTLIAALQLVNRICDAAISMSDSQIRAMSWSRFVSDVTEPELIQYLKERKLYINDPVESEEDL